MLHVNLHVTFFILKGIIMKHLLFFFLLSLQLTTYTLQKKIAGYVGPACMMIGGFNTVLPSSGGFVGEVMGMDPETATKICMYAGLCCFFCGGKMIDYAQEEQRTITEQPGKETNRSKKDTSFLFHPHSE